MSVEIRLLVPKAIYEALEKKAKENNLKLEDLIIRAVVRIIEEERRR
jgi:hypothetical protein